MLIYADGGAGHPVLQDKHREVIGDLVKRGVGLGCAHYGVEIPSTNGGPEFLEWIGGYYEHLFSVNPMWTPEFKKFPDHAITRGVKPFSNRDEWYFNMRFRGDMKGITPILVATPSDKVRDGPYVYPGGPYEHIQKNKGRPETMMWAYERPDGGRGFGFTGGHTHANWGYENQRKVVLNALLWIFLPFYLRNGFYTVPEYLNRRFGPGVLGQRVVRAAQLGRRSHPGSEHYPCDVGGRGLDHCCTTGRASHNHAGGHAIGRLGQRSKRSAPRGQPRLVFGGQDGGVCMASNPDTGRGNNLFVEDDQTARIDWIERGVRAVGFVQNVPELQLVVDLSQRQTIALAIPPIVGREAAGGVVPQPPRPRIDADGARARHGVGKRTRQTRVRRKQTPTVTDRHNRFALLTHTSQELDEVLYRVERLFLAPPKDHFLRNALVRRRGRAGGRNPGVARRVSFFSRISQCNAIAFAPPVALQQAFDHKGAPREGHVGQLHRRHHDPDVVVGTDEPVERVDERLGNLARCARFHMLGIEKQHEHARARILNRLARLRNRVRLGPAFAGLLRDDTLVQTRSEAIALAKELTAQRRQAP